jgi:acyl carrier protein
MIDIKAIIDILAHETSLDPATLSSETVIRELEVDSLGMMNVIFGIEDATGVELKVEEMEEVVTIGDLVRLVNSKISVEGSEPSGDAS